MLGVLYSSAMLETSLKAHMADETAWRLVKSRYRSWRGGGAKAHLFRLQLFGTRRPHSSRRLVDASRIQQGQVFEWWAPFGALAICSEFRGLREVECPRGEYKTKFSSPLSARHYDR
ncbi:hypothetical protein MRX96_016014 [Rhipicephalus microplus]